VEHFEIEADEFKRHCASKGVLLQTIKEAFSNCKPKVAPTKELKDQQRFSAVQVAQKKQKKNSISIFRQPLVKPPFK
jgi:hypothetical protein